MDTNESSITKVYNYNGRVKSVRVMGKSSFVHIMSYGEAIQLYAKKDVTENFDEFLNLKVGDLISVHEAEEFVTKTGEPSLRVLKFKIQHVPVISMPFPKSTEDAEYFQITDKETRYRQRYIDLQINPEVYKIFRLRSDFIYEIRKYLTETHYFTEVETPILQPVYGGATAKPFITKYNSLNQDMYLRIAPELYLKRLLVGGFEKIFEIGKNFRNEGMDKTHNPEFTMIEIYQAYADYCTMSVLFQELISHLSKKFLGKAVMMHKIHQYNNLVPKEIPLAEKDDYFKQHVQSTLQDLCSVVNYPRELVPLAKEHGVKGLAEKAQFYWKGVELANIYSEQNDYEEQRRMFMNQVNTDYPLDEDFLQALKYGMPPAGGMGIGIDRLFMTMFDIDSIKEVILFPHLRT